MCVFNDPCVKGSWQLNRVSFFTSHVPLAVMKLFLKTCRMSWKLHRAAPVCSWKAATWRSFRPTATKCCSQIWVSTKSHQTRCVLNKDTVQTNISCQTSPVESDKSSTGGGLREGVSVWSLNECEQQMSQSWRSCWVQCSVDGCVSGDSSSLWATGGGKKWLWNTSEMMILAVDER